MTGKKRGFKLNLMMKLILINTLIIISILILSTLRAISVSTGSISTISRSVSDVSESKVSDVAENIGKISEDKINDISTNINQISESKISDIADEVVENINNGLNVRLKKAAEISINILKDKSESLLREANVVGGTDSVVALVAFNRIKRKQEFSESSFKQDAKSKSKFQVEYKKGNLLSYKSLANKVKINLYGSRDASQEIEFINQEGKVKGSTNSKSPFKEENNSENVKLILETKNGLTLTDIISKEEGLAIKAYGQVYKATSQEYQPGIALFTLPLDMDFAREIKNITNTEVAIYNKEKFLYSTFYSKGKLLSLEDEKAIYENLANGSLIELSDKVLDLGQGNEKFRFAYIPIKNHKDEMVGMLSVAAPTSELDKAIKQFENNKSSMLFEIKEKLDILKTTFTGQINSELELIKETIVSEIGNELSKVTKTIRVRITNQLIIVAFFGLVLGMIAISFYASRISETIKKILEAVNKVSEGNLTLKVKVSRNDELGDLSSGINNMINNLKLMVYQISDMSEKIASSTAQISATSESNKSSMQDIVNVANEIQQQSNLEADRITEAVDFISHIHKGIKEIAKHSESVAEKSHNSSSDAKNGEVAVNEAIESINSIKTTVKETASIVDVLQERTKVIDQVITVITGIADQTNLLALNAAIEAARAGEVGKGFAVVANEVKKLANQSAEAAEEIRKIIVGIQEEAKNVTSSVERGMKEVDNGVAITKKAGQALKSIIDSVYETTEMVTAITAATQEQSASSDEAMRTMEEISAGSEQTNRISEIIANEAKARLIGVEEIVQGVNVLLEGSEVLNSMTDVFEIGQDFDLSEDYKQDLKGMKEVESNDK